MAFERLLSGDNSDEKRVGVLRAFAQDENGFIWIGGEEGLARYDGHHYLFYSYEGYNGELPSSFIYDLHLDSRSTLWIGTANGAARYRPEQDSFEAIDSSKLCDPDVRGIASDSQGNLFLATDQCLNVLTKEGKISAFFPNNDGTPSELNEVSAIAIDAFDRVWLGTNEGLALFDLKTENFQVWPLQFDRSNQYDSGVITLCVTDEFVWLGTLNQGMFRFDIHQKSFKPFRRDPNTDTSIGSDIIYDIYEDKQKRLWVATDRAGLALYNPITETFKHFINNPYAASSISSNKLRVIFQDTSNNLWIGAFPSGVNFYDNSRKGFKWLKSQPDDTNSLSNNGVLSILEDSQQNIWIGTEKGLNRYNPKTKRYKHYLESSDDNGLKNDVVVVVKEDKNQNLWVGTWSGGLYYFDRKQDTFEHFYLGKDNSKGLAGINIWRIEIEDNGELWIATVVGEGLSHYNPETGVFTQFSHDPEDPHSLSNNDLSDIMLDSNNRLWVATIRGLSWYNRQSHQFVHIQHFKNSDYIIRTIVEDTQNNLWIGTDTNGIFVYSPEQDKVIKHLSLNDGLLSPAVSAMHLDRQNYIWFASHRGIGRISPLNYDIETYTKNEGLVGNVTNRDAIWLAKDDTLYIGSTEGVTYFKPNEIKVFPESPRPSLTGLRILNEATQISETGPLKKAINHSPLLSLPYDTPMFTLEFSALSFQSPEKNRYAYKLEGFDDDWNHVGNQTYATYTNIDPGKYVFHLKAANKYKVWAESRPLPIVIPPPWWQTIWFYAICILSVLASIYLYIAQKTKRLRQEREKERAINEELINLDKLKNAFLANVSHELRTPLNGIVGIADSIVDTPQPFESLNPKIHKILDSGNKLSSLVDDILDFTLLVNRRMQLHKKPVALNRVINRVIDKIQTEATLKGLHITNFSPESKAIVYGDENKLEKILSDLLGNAIKYTARGEISIEVRMHDKDCEIAVTDTGIGMEREQIHGIFDAFYQVDFTDTRSYQGAGLGLALVSHLVQLHDGSVAVKSEKDFGSQFIVSLPRCLTYEDPELDEEVQRIATEEQKILIVDDEPVNLLVLSGILQNQGYQVIEAKNGMEALERIKEEMPLNLVILDIMMPLMSGLETCQKIREHYSKSELPVVFLSAKSRTEMFEQAFAAGGNDYLSKPIDKDLLVQITQKFSLRFNG